MATPTQLRGRIEEAQMLTKELTTLQIAMGKKVPFFDEVTDLPDGEFIDTVIADKVNGGFKFTAFDTTGGIHHETYLTEECPVREFVLMRVMKLIFCFTKIEKHATRHNGNITIDDRVIG